MILAGMIRADEDLFICDMAETYHIFDYKSVDIGLLATLASGLRESSRIKCKMSEIPIELSTFFLAGIYDKINWIAWSRTQQAEQNQGCPQAILPKLLGIEEEKELVGFASGVDFNEAWQQITGG